MNRNGLDETAGPTAVGYVPGLILLGRTEVLRPLGGLRPEFFMYCEDTDLCFRLLRQNCAILVEPRARCRHFDPPPSTEPPGLAFHKYKNFVCVYLLHAPARVLPVFVARYGLLALIRSLPRPEQRRVLWSAWAWAAARMPRLLAERLGLLAMPAISPEVP